MILPTKQNLDLKILIENYDKIIILMIDKTKMTSANAAKVIISDSKEIAKEEIERI